jgi:lipopolysaccharide export system permease protein
VFNELVVPAANYRATAILVSSIQEERPFWQTKDIFYPNFEEVQLPSGETVRRLQSLFYAKRFDGEQMKVLTILEWLGENLEKIVVSDAASWNSSKNTWDMFNGAIYHIAPDASYREAIAFDHKQFALPKAPFEFALQGRDPYEMNILQAQQYLKLLRLVGDEKKLSMFQVRIQQKLAFPFICFVFGLVGSVLGVQLQNVSRGTSFGLCVAIIFGYYIVAFLAGSFGQIGLLTPVVAAWLPNVLGLGVGWILLYRAAH